MSGKEGQEGSGKRSAGFDGTFEEVSPNWRGIHLGSVLEPFNRVGLVQKWPQTIATGQVNISHRSSVQNGEVEVGEEEYTRKTDVF